VGNSITVTQNPVICSGTTYVLPGGTPVTVAGIYIDTISFAGGCDSIITTNLTVHPTSTASQNASICSGNNYVLPGGSTVSAAGVYTDATASSPQR
jgi:phosphosulfolactate synthase (CoM biosynthesis protein A)